MCWTVTGEKFCEAKKMYFMRFTFRTIIMSQNQSHYFDVAREGCQKWIDDAVMTIECQLILKLAEGEFAYDVTFKQEEGYFEENDDFIVTMNVPERFHKFISKSRINAINERLKSKRIEMSDGCTDATWIIRSL